jgi:hypothetical protein
VLLQVTEALAQAGLESSNLIVGIDFTKSNEWTGSQMTFPSFFFTSLDAYLCFSMSTLCCTGTHYTLSYQTISLFAWFWGQTFFSDLVALPIW